MTVRATARLRAKWYRLTEKNPIHQSTVPSLGISSTVVHRDNQNSIKIGPPSQILHSIYEISFSSDVSRTSWTYNIAVQTILKERKREWIWPHDDRDVFWSVGPIADLKEYAFAVNSDEPDPIGRTRGIVVVCRKSGQRREDLESVLITGNSANACGERARCAFSHSR